MLVCTMCSALGWTSLQGHLQNEITSSISCTALIITQADYVTFYVDVRHNVQHYLEYTLYNNDNPQYYKEYISMVLQALFSPVCI